jgi:mRNA interferase MazF
VGLKRGDVIVVAPQGDLGKPRPAVVVETDRLVATNHVLVCPGTSDLTDHSPNRRLLALPNAENGLRLPTQFQADKITPARRDKCGEIIGKLDSESMEHLNRLLVVLLGLLD